MKFAICNETFGERDFEQVLALVAECGYHGIELAPFTLGASPAAVSAERRQEIHRSIAAAGLECVGLHWLLAKTEGFHLTSPEPETRRRTAEYLGELARLCRDVGGKVLVFGSPAQRSLPEGAPYNEGFTYAVEVLRNVAPVLAECDVTLALEPLGPQETNFMNTADQAAEIAAAVDSPWCQLHLDAKALATESEPPGEIIRRHAALLAHFHVNDPNLQGPGMGELDLTPHLQALKDIGYDGWLSVEVFDLAPGPEHIARESIAYLRELCRKLGIGVE